ncbi:dickkopf-related protein 1 [Arapaima gigas]
MQPSAVNSLLALWVALWGYFEGDCAAAVLHKSNSIKTAQPVTAPPDLAAIDSGSFNVAVDSVQLQPITCASDDECAEDEFCNGSRGACLPCRKRKKRCIRDAVCCPGNFCSNGVCTPIDFDTLLFTGMDPVELDSFVHENSTLVPQSKWPTPRHPQSVKGQMGDLCLRSTDCSEVARLSMFSRQTHQGLSPTAADSTTAEVQHRKPAAASSMTLCEL